MRKILIIITIFDITSFCFLSPYLHKATAYDGSVHIEIDKHAINQSNLDEYLKNQLCFAKGIKQLVKDQEIRWWIEHGGEAEDYGKGGKYTYWNSRAYNHFHDPLKDWDEAGLDNFLINELYEYYYGRSPVSPILWGLDPGRQDFPENTTGDWSWKKARDYYYNALTALAEDERNRDFADCFRALGQVMHLLQDASVPLHTRNDVHIFPFRKWKGEYLPLGIEFGEWTYETYTEENIESLNYYAINPDPILLNDPQPQSKYSYLVPISGLFDRNQYNEGDGIPLNNNIIGLAEYSNANFVTQDTLWTYQHPSLDDTNYASIDWLNPEQVDAEDGEVDNRIYIKKIVGEIIDYFAVVDYWSWEYQGHIYDIPGPFSLDKECWEDYATRLIPRAVGYSAGLLDYFFRGIMDVQDVSLQKDGSGKITGLDMNVKNVTPLGEGIEPMDGGSLSLAYEYTLSGQDEAVFGHVEEIYTIIDDSDPINSEYVPVEISLVDPIPSTMQEFTCTLIYRGKLGGEDDAVVAKVLPFTYTSRIAFSFQQGGGGNVSNIYTIFPDGTGKIQISDTSDGRLYDFNPSWSPDGKMLAFDAHTDDPFNSDIIVIDMTSPEPYPNNILTILDSGGAEDEWHDVAPSFSLDGEKILAIKSESEFTRILIIFDIASGSWEAIPNTLSDWINGPPKMSPQGDKIVYSADEWTGSGIIWLMNPDGTAKVNLTDDDYNNYDPDWSPDGQWIVFVSDRDGGDFLDLWIMDRTGGNMRQIAGWGTSCRGPSFSPDGESIVFSTLGGIYIINIDGSGLTELTAEGYFTGRPDWSPPTFIYGG